MTLSTRCLAGGLILLLCTYPTPLPAQVIPGKWQKVELLPAGSPIVIKTFSGEVLDCFYFHASREILLVVESISKEQRRIPKSTVRQIIAKDYDDRLLNGGLTGLVAGAAAGILITSVTDTARNNNTAGDHVLGALLFGLLGMGFGSLIDYKHKGREVVYEAPAGNIR
jgi:hypothetical protein